MGSQRIRHYPAAIPAHAKRSSKQGLRRGRAQRDDDTRRYRRNLGLQPRKARFYLDRPRLAMDASRASWHPFEMLDNVCNVSVRSVEPGLDEATVEQPSRRSDKRTSGKVLGVPRLLADLA
jgi:hypothetical protein